MEQGFLSTDVGPHFLDSLEFLLSQTNKVERDERVWPWVFVSTANLFQAACVLHLDERDTASISCLDNQSQTEFWARLNSEKPALYRRPKMKNPRDLFKSVRKLEEVEFSSAEISAFNDVIRIRNEFFHFTPKGHTLILDGVPTTVRLCIDAIVSILRVKGMYADLRIDSTLRNVAISKLIDVGTQMDAIEKNSRKKTN